MKIRWPNRFADDLAEVIDNANVRLCLRTGQPIPPGVAVRRRNRQERRKATR